MRTALVAVSLMLCSLHGYAEGQFQCVFDDANAKGRVDGTYSFGGGSRLVELNGDIRIKVTTGPVEIKEIPLRRRHVTQYWHQPGELNVASYWELAGEPGFSNSADIVIETVSVAGNPNRYHGRYEILTRVRDPRQPNEVVTHLNGTANCTVQ